MINGHGDDIHNAALSIDLNFSSNIYPQINKDLQSYIRNKVSTITNYPEPLARDLSKRIEVKNNLPNNSVLVTNGAVEAFYIIAEYYCKKRSLIFIPSFSEYEDACSVYNHKMTFASCKDIHKINYNKFDIIWLCNPNNPDGTIINAALIEELISTCKNTLFIIDEAYAGFITENQSVLHMVNKVNNLIIVSSLTKRYAIPGLRLGFIASHPAHIKALSTKLMPWRVNSLAIEAGKFCLSNEYTDSFNIRELVCESQRVQNEIDKIPGFAITPSETTFFICQAPGTASELKQYLLNKHKMLIRDASNFRSLSAKHFRISIRIPEQNNQLIQALKEWNPTC